MKRLLAFLLLAALCFASACTPASAEGAAYRSTQSFIDVLTHAGQPYTLHGVDEDGDEWLTLENPGDPFAYTVTLLFGRDQKHASIRVWYVMDYDASRLTEVARVCNALNSQSRFLCLYADESDHTVTASMDLIFRDGDAGQVTAEALRRLTDALHQARPQLLACLAPGSAAGTIVVTADSARLRDAPSVTSGYIATASRGDSFPCLGAVEGWYAVAYSGRRAYVSAEKVTLVEPEAAPASAPAEDGELVTLAVSDRVTGRNYTVQLLYGASGETALLSVPGLITYREAQRDSVLRICNTLNSTYLYTRFIADEEQRTVTASIELLLGQQDAEDVVQEALERLQSILQEAYPALAPYGS